MNEYEAKREARIERLRARAEAARSECNRRFGAAQAIQSYIPFGQPIMYGHHSAKRHLRDIEKIDGHMRKGCEAMDKANHYEAKADAAENNTAISSDDPEAIAKLREKLADLEQRQADMKAVNAAHRAYVKNPASLERSGLSDRLKARVRLAAPQIPTGWGKAPHPPFELSNNNANIARVRERIAALEKQHAAAEAMPQAVTQAGNGWRVIEDAADNRLRVEFDAKPSEDVRQRLRSAGFRWSPTRKAWVRQLNNAARYAVGHVVKDLT